MWRAQPKRRRGCMGGNSAGIRWWPCSTLRTSSPLSSTTESCRTYSRVAVALHNVVFFFKKIFDRTRAVIPIGFESYLVEFRAEPVYI